MATYGSIISWLSSYPATTVVGSWRFKTANQETNTIGHTARGMLIGNFIMILKLLPQDTQLLNWNIRWGSIQTVSLEEWRTDLNKRIDAFKATRIIKD